VRFDLLIRLASGLFWRLGLDGAVPNHSTFSKNRHGRFRDSDLLREVFEATVRWCMEEGLVGGEGFAVDASLIRADVDRQRRSTTRSCGTRRHRVSRRSRRCSVWRRDTSNHFRPHSSLENRTPAEIGAGSTGKPCWAHAPNTVVPITPDQGHQNGPRLYT